MAVPQTAYNASQVFLRKQGRVADVPRWSDDNRALPADLLAPLGHNGISAE
ncbi:hypothetical protein [Allokutzneria sp. NRRL B-24872]|uniref:hypothetical protein n=1 Tax=Allokutzneria sp. NRRL B-24872 TaxID=1137961 RepID=UPI00143DA14E|nr:hypothetical protein [Allokutzneria sp. NRRL B-24872]